MKIKVQIVIEHDDDQPDSIVEEIYALQRGTPTLETIGLTLAEGKEILASIQEQIVTHQVADHIQQYQSCVHCHQKCRRNGYQDIIYRTLFGKLKLRGQRFYSCPCQEHLTKTFSPITSLISEGTAPEFSYLQAKWSSLMSYGLTVKLLEEVLPLSANIATTFRQTQAVAQKLEDELGEEQVMYIDSAPREWEKLPLPNERLFVGIDGGFIHARDAENRKAGWFEAIVGKSLLKNQPSKRFAFVQTYDEKPKRRLFETLQSHGM